MGRHRGEVITRVSKIQKLISELFIFSDELIRFYNFMDFQYITSFQRGDLQSATNIIAEGRCYMLDLEKKKRQEINNMVAILEQIDLPDIILLTRDANTLLLRQQEQCRDAESKRSDG